MGLSNQRSMEDAVAKDVNPCDIPGNLKRFLRMLYHHKHYQIGLEWITQDKMKKGL